MALELPKEGDFFRGWRLEKELDAGNSGRVYRAERAGKVRALKIYFPDKIDEFGSREQVERLERQLQLVDHDCPNLVQIFDGGRDDSGLFFLLMALVEGTALHRLTATLPRDRIGPLIEQVAKAAHYLEGRGFCHRDIKPDNIVVSPDLERATLLDVGVIRPVDRGESANLSEGNFVGTTRYSPPEFVLKNELSSDERALRAITFYQLGATLHDMVMRERIFSQYDRPRGRLYHAIQTVTPLVEASDVPEYLVLLAKKSLLKDWNERTARVSWDDYLLAAQHSAVTVPVRERVIQAQLENRQTERLVLDVVNPEDVTHMWHVARRLAQLLQQHLQADPIYPKFTTHRARVGVADHAIRIRFDPDTSRGLSTAFEVRLLLRPSPGESHLALITYQCFGEAVDAGPLTALESVISIEFDKLPRELVNFFESSLEKILAR